ncbi:amidohydrolase [Microbacterium horticulturae]|uniref:Amidohydrolase n=1 Tax=Microbacterium horticulturae TaxID=3028316 RepID=A0ABY8BZ34_9MICO|nr:amidohydrolase [Microbacterium sp. KACC 23027]WEG09424.1 amidohydrolase [Microbacterium sp. KACC 23027]
MDDASDEPAPAPAGTADPGAGRGPDWLDTALRAELPRLVRLRRHLHAHPELSWQENATTALLHDVLAAAGIPAQVLPGGTGLVAEIDGGAPGPVIGLRADIDALPVTEGSGLPFASTVAGVAHACGHDVHTTVLVGTALALHAAPVFVGRVRLLFQPAEERMPGGSHQLVASGALDGVGRLFALHCDPRVPVGQVGLRVGPITSACDMIELEVTGPGGHTSRPHLTVDVVGALATVATRLPLLVNRRLDPRSGAVLVWGAIQAGAASNVIPRQGTLGGTLRVMDRAAWELAEPVVTELVEQLLAPSGAEHRLTYIRGVPPVVNDTASVALLQSAVTAGIGTDAVVEAEQSAGAEDFAVLLDHAPGALARLGVWDGLEPQVDLHSSAFRADERAIPVGVRTLVHTVLAAG